MPKCSLRPGKGIKGEGIKRRASRGRGSGGWGKKGLADEGGDCELRIINSFKIVRTIISLNVPRYAEGRSEGLMHYLNTRLTCLHKDKCTVRQRDSPWSGALACE